jgi:hypothetical protein
MAKKFLKKLLTYETASSHEEFVVYLVECQLATVATMACAKRINKSEYARHLLIAQNGIDYIKNNMLAYPEYMRINKILMSESKTVEDWAKRYLYK